MLGVVVVVVVVPLVVVVLVFCFSCRQCEQTESWHADGDKSSTGQCFPGLIGTFHYFPRWNGRADALVLCRWPSPPNTPFFTTRTSLYFEIMRIIL